MASEPKRPVPILPDGSWEDVIRYLTGQLIGSPWTATEVGWNTALRHCIRELTNEKAAARKADARNKGAAEQGVDGAEPREP